jgi:hypothetical protein
MSSDHMKRDLPLYIIRELQIKILIKYHHKPVVRIVEKKKRKLKVYFFNEHRLKNSQ